MIPKYLHLSHIVDNFDKKLSIVDIVALIETDSDLTNLYNIFYQYKNRVFEAHERLVILAIDTDYYPALDSVSNTLFNVFEIIADLDISLNHVVILTNCPGVEKEIFYLCDIKNLFYPKVINFMLWYTYPLDMKFFSIGTAEKKFLYSCLNGVARTHRKTFMALLYKNNLIDQGLISYYPEYSQPPLANSPTIIEKAGTAVAPAHSLTFRTTVPFSRINESLSLCRQSKLLHVEYQHQLNTAIKSPSIIGEPNSLTTQWQANFLQESLVYIITESVGEYPYPFITEKTWKAMVSCMPFMIVGPRHSLKFLADAGFKTFSDFWDESYDNKSSVYQRCSIIIDNLKQLAGADWTKLSLQMQPIIKHNFDHLSTFKDRETDKIRNLTT
jgi:hypothetical protein